MSKNKESYFSAEKVDSSYIKKNGKRNVSPLKKIISFALALSLISSSGVAISKLYKEKHNDFFIDFSKEDCIKITEYTEGNRVKNLKIGNLNLSGVEVRNIFGLKSANFKIVINENDIKFEVIGYGHGVGMSQTGADSLAKEGKNYEEIIKHYYSGVEIQNI